MQKTIERERQLALRITTNRLYRLAQDIKRLEVEKAKLRDVFFTLADEELQAERVMGRMLLDVPNGEDSAANWVAREYPGWRIVQEIEGSTFVQIEEDPAYQKFSFVNPDNGMVFSRQIAMVDVTFDTEGFSTAHPDLADECIAQRTVYELDQKRAERLTETNPESVVAFQEFTSRGKLQARLAAPRKATEDDLA